MATNAPGIVKKSSSYFADPDALVRRKDWNPRFDFGDMKELETSIETNGFRNEKPILVRRNAEMQLEIVDGDRRVTAVHNLMKRGVDFSDGIPIVFEAKDTDDLHALIHMFTANNGKQFLPLEEAAAYKRMIDAGMKVKNIEQHVGRKEAHIRLTLGLLTAGEELQEAVKTGAIKATLGKRIAQKTKGNKEKQKELVEKATKGGKASKKLAKEETEAIKRRPTSKASQKQLLPNLLNESQLHTRELLLANRVESEFKAMGLKLDDNEARHYFAATDDRAAAFHFGVLLGLRAALGMDSKITL